MAYALQYWIPPLGPNSKHTGWKYAGEVYVEGNSYPLRSQSLCMNTAEFPTRQYDTIEEAEAEVPFIRSMGCTFQMRVVEFEILFKEVKNLGGKLERSPRRPRDEG